MNNDIIVSVIMGVYNTPKDMLLLSVNSIIKQTLHNIEFIICDDGSNNIETIDCLKQISLVDRRIVFIKNKKNMGLAYSLNECIKISQGKYIARQDSDDESTMNRLEIQFDFMEHHPEYAIVGTLAAVFTNNGFSGIYSVPEKPFKENFYWSSPFNHPTVMLRKACLTDSGSYRVSKETRRCEDYDLFMTMYSKGYIGYNIQKSLYKYRFDDGFKKHRPMKYRFDEVKIRKLGFKKLSLPKIKSCLFIVKPLFVGIIPQNLLMIIKKNQYAKKGNK